MTDRILHPPRALWHSLALFLAAGFTTVAQGNEFSIDVWADNWFKAYLNGQVLLEDSVSIRTERSFNAESRRFSADYPLNLAFIIKDFKQDDTGLEYIGTRRQQMGDGGFIMQITDLASGEVVAVSDSAMRCRVIHKAPLGDGCVSARDPVPGQGNCGFHTEPEPVGWQSAGFDASGWPAASVYGASQVRPKGGYDRIRWDARAKLIWSGDLEKDNTLLCRLSIQPASSGSAASSSHRHQHFSHFPGVRTREQGDYLTVSSNGMPNHGMMTGITSWQQQVPLPQDYTGDNSWKIPLNPKLADQPLSLKAHFHKGAVAIAVNGVPIFNALNNRGEYAAQIGELDQWGGHSGRADDYHYHLAPEHLEAVVGKGRPIAYALDGFPLYARTDQPLDEYLGRFNADGGYQYHAVGHPPYFIAAMRGEVRTDSPDRAPEDQIVPQPRSQPVRNRNYGPLHGARITGFRQTGEQAYSLEYRIDNETRQVNYRWTEAGEYRFSFVDGSGRETQETYRKHTRDGRRPRSGPGENRRPPRGDKPRKRRFCGDGLCDHTENVSRCPTDCL